MSHQIKIVIVDDHVLLRSGLAGIVADMGYTVLYECGHGKELLQRLPKQEQPDLILMDINMPTMDGFETTLHLKNNYPDIKVIALSMFDDDTSIIRMLRNGARGYILKDINPTELKTAIADVLSKGYYYSDLVSGNLLHSIQQSNDDTNNDDIQKVLQLKDRDIEFLRLTCSEKTYKEIADQMGVSPRTIDGYRDELFERLGIKSRIGLVLFTIKNGIIHFK
jgi:two-component system, NarL family, invasion response regulator UvrY